MRLNPTEPEKRLWRLLSNAQLGGYKFRRQHVVLAAYAIIDLFCPAVGLGVEVDGDTHDVAYDRRRDQRLQQPGFTIIRFGNTGIMTIADGVAQSILATARSLTQRWRNGTSPPQPSDGSVLPPAGPERCGATFTRHS